LGRTRAEAQAKFDQLQELVDPLAGLGSLYGTFGDLSGYPLEGPVPEEAIGKLGLRSISAELRERVRREKPTIRELYLRSGITGSARIGTHTDIADAMQEWFENGICDGFNITPTHLPGGCEDFVELVVPELQRRGLFRTEYEGKTLRENLGLKRPVSRYAAAGLDRNLDTAK
jgi:alkanesulfonate monooxygenase SsuD/methylene tetrahydromethanopterin reductase-like flavin-dependent oxidoreductase (luciferase family)